MNTTQIPTRLFNELFATAEELAECGLVTITSEVGAYKIDVFQYVEDEQMSIEFVGVGDESIELKPWQKERLQGRMNVLIKDYLAEREEEQEEDKCDCFNPYAEYGVSDAMFI